MATVDKDRIVLGSTYQVRYSTWKKRTPRGYRTANQLAVGPDDTAARDPYPPSAAEVELWSQKTQTFVELEPGLTTAVAAITDNVATYLITEDVLNAEGDYKVSMALTFPDGQRKVEKRSFQVVKKQ